MFAHDCAGPGVAKRFRHIGEQRYVELHSMPFPIVKVKLTESLDGEYFGWLQKDSDKPTHIWGHQGLFDMCFPGGALEEEAKGNGQIIRLDISPA